MTKLTKNQIEWLQNMEPFFDSDYIPSVPRTDDPEEYKNIIVKNFIRCGAIPKSDLIIGLEYSGSCRNSSKAVWTGTHFEYTRHKWGSAYTDTINHFEDDDGYDLFVPIKQIK